MRLLQLKGVIMKWFNDYLKEFLEEKGISVVQFSKEAKLNYAAMLKIIKGEQNPSKKHMSKIFEHPSLNEEEVTYLKAIYKESLITVEDKHKVEFAEQTLNRIYETIVETSSLHMLKHTEKDQKQLTKVSDVCQNINEQIFKTYNLAVRKSLVNPNYVFNMVIYLPPKEALIHEVYHTLSAINECNKDMVKLNVDILIDFYHPEMIKTLAYMSNLPKYIQMVKLNDFVTVKCIEAEILKLSELFPYGIIFEDSRILLNEDATEYIVMVDDDVNYKLYNDGKYRKMDAVFFAAEDINDWLYDKVTSVNYLNYNDYTLRYSFNSLSLPGDVVKKRLKKSLLTLNLSSFSGMDLKMTSRFKTRLDRTEEKIKSGTGLMTHFLCIKGIQEFLDDGILRDYAEVVGAFSEIERLHVVKQALERMRVGYNLQLLNQNDLRTRNFLRVIEYFEIYTDDKELMIIKHFDKNKLNLPEKTPINFNGRCIEYAVSIKDSLVTESFKIFYKRVLSRIALSTESSFSRLQDMANATFGGHKDLKITALLAEINQMDFKESNSTKVIM